METQGDVFLSICKGDWAKVDELLSCENKPKYFITACKHYPDIAKILLKLTFRYSQSRSIMYRCRRQFPLEKDEKGNSPLHFAARNNDIELVSMMLEANFNINSKNNMSQTPLYSAMKSHSFQVAEILLSNRGRMYCMSPELQFDIVACAIEGGSVSLVEKLLDYPWFDNDTSISNFIQGTTLTENGKNLLHIAVNNSIDPDDTSSHLIPIGGKRPSINYEREEALVPIVRVLLLKYKFDINMTDSKGKTPLHIAVNCESEEITEELLSHNPDIHCKSNIRAFKTAIKKIHYSHIIDKFVQIGFTLESTDKNNVELFHTAADKGFFNIVKQFVKLGINVNIQDNKWSAIYFAIVNSKVNIVTYLLRNNAFVERCKDDTYEEMHGTYYGPLLLLTNRDAVDPAGHAFLYYPHHINPETIRVLMEYFIQHGADINTMFSDHDYYESPLEFVIMRNDIYEYPDTAIAAAEVLLRHGAIVNHIFTESFRGGTYLHSSFFDESQEMVKLLLDYDADVDVENNKGHTPLYVAVDSHDDNPAIVKLLLDHGAHVVDQSLRYHKRYQKYGIIKMHIEKLIQADLYVSPDLVVKYSPLNNNDETDSYRTEVKLMMTTPLADSNTTYYTLLKQTSHHEILKILRNERVWQSLESEEYRKVFPNYGYMIFGQFRRGRQRMKLVQILLENRHLVRPQLDSECLEEIVSYLTNPELRNLVHALVPIKILNEAYKKVEDNPDYKEVEANSDYSDN